ncbi:MAG: hypothetical protein AAB152_12210 [Candidatus Coatesbacteria bacterium]
MIRTIVVLSCLAGRAAAGGWLSTPDLPRVEGMTRVLEGTVRINLTSARYAVSAGPLAAVAPAFEAAARAAGWVPEQAGRRVFPVPGGALDLRAYRAGTRWLLQGVTDGRPGEPDSCFAVQALFDGVPPWADGAGEAPGRDPAGWPRISSARRLLHLGGRGFEAACYATSAPPSGVLAEAARRLPAAGWRTEPLGAGGLAATRAGRPDTALWTRPDGTGTVFIVIATEEVR